MKTYREILNAVRNSLVNLAESHGNEMTHNMHQALWREIEFIDHEVELFLKEE